MTQSDFDFPGYQPSEYAHPGPAFPTSGFDGYDRFPRTSLPPLPPYQPVSTVVQADPLPVLPPVRKARSWGAALVVVSLLLGLAVVMLVGEATKSGPVQPVAAATVDRTTEDACRVVAVMGIKTGTLLNDAVSLMAKGAKAAGEGDYATGTVYVQQAFAKEDEATTMLKDPFNLAQATLCGDGS